VKYTCCPLTHDIPVISISPTSKPTVISSTLIAINPGLVNAVVEKFFTNTKLSLLSTQPQGVNLNILILTAALPLADTHPFHNLQVPA
jgi:hypothetical protein